MFGFSCFTALVSIAAYRQMAPIGAIPNIRHNGLKTAIRCDLIECPIKAKTCNRKLKVLTKNYYKNQIWPSGPKSGP